VSGYQDRDDAWSLVHLSQGLAQSAQEDVFLSLSRHDAPVCD